MAAKKASSATGAAQATAILSFIEGLAGSKALAVGLKDEMREDGKLTQGQLLEYLAEGGRDLSLTEADASKLQRKFMADITQGLKEVQRTTPSHTSTEGAKGYTKRAKTVAARVYKKSVFKLGEEEKALLLARASSGAIEPAKDEDYIKYKQKKYGSSQVLQASGSLLRWLKSAKIEKVK